MKEPKGFRYNPDRRLVDSDGKPYQRSGAAKPIQAIFQLVDEKVSPPERVSLIVYLDGTYAMFGENGSIRKAGMAQDLTMEEVRTESENPENPDLEYW